jgi:hypothetical protein
MAEPIGKIMTEGKRSANKGTETELQEFYIATILGPVCVHNHANTSPSYKKLAVTQSRCNEPCRCIRFQPPLVSGLHTLIHLRQLYSSSRCTRMQG